MGRVFEKFGFCIVLLVFVGLGIGVDLSWSHSDFGLTRIFTALVIGFWLGFCYYNFAIANKKQEVKT